jgi:hypothetical protein
MFTSVGFGGFGAEARPRRDDPLWEELIPGDENHSPHFLPSVTAWADSSYPLLYIRNDRQVRALEVQEAL